MEANRTRRKLLAAATLFTVVGPATATPEQMAAAISGFTNGAVPRAGKVKLDVAELVDNGNAVPVTVSVESPMTAADHVTGIAIFNQKNPLPEVAKFTFGPRAAKAQVSTRIRLATSQTLTAVARMSDGSFWSHSVDVVVTLAACIETEG
jgi:sulfur-oxidizing protein SoxY